MNRHQVFLIALVAALLLAGPMLLSGWSVWTNPQGSVLERTSFSSEVVGNVLRVTIFGGKQDQWPSKGSVQVWLADLSKTPVALANAASFAPGQKSIEADLPISGWEPAKRSRYVLWYKITDGDKVYKSAASLREIYGSLRARILAPTTFLVGGNGTFRVIVQDYYSKQPLSGVKVAARFETDTKKQSLVDAATDENGTVQFEFPVPATLGDSAKLIVAAVYGDEKLEEEAQVQFDRAARVMITSDKPLYQPGQTMHLRSLTLSKANRNPAADVAAEFVVEDAKGNKVFRKKGKTDAYGIFAADFTLASQVNMGNYKVRATVGKDTAEKTVEVKRYVLPKFKVTVQPDRKYYKPGETVSGTVSADYVFGKPTADSKVTITGFATIVGAEKFATINGRTNKDGKYAFELPLPSYMVGQKVHGELARVQIQAEVEDNAKHKQTALLSVYVAQEPFNIMVMPESAQLVQGVSNRMFVVVSRPDGSPAKVSFADPFKAVNVVTDDMGLAVIETPPVENPISFKLQVADEQGNKASKQFHFGIGYNQKVLMRTDRPVYRVGDQAQVSLISGGNATTGVYVDVITNKQTVLTMAGDLKNGVAEIQLPITTDMVGTTVLHAYVLDPEGNMYGDTRLIYINDATDLHIGIKPTKKTFLPGKEAAIDFEVTDAQGHPVAAALGVTIVDEAVFALQDMQPGFEKIFFTLEKELMKPRYEIHRFTPENIVFTPKLDKERALGYEAMLSSVEPAVSYGVNVLKEATLSKEDREYLDSQMQRQLKEINQALKNTGNPQQLQWSDVMKVIPEELKTDPWGQVFKLQNFYDGKVVQLLSAGADRHFNTADDLWVTDPKWQKENLARPVMLRMKMANAPMGGAIGDGMAVDRFAVAEEAEMIEDVSVAQATTGAKKTGENQNAGIRIRKFFPETLYTNPALITDAKGKARINLTMADSITTWRIGAMANSAQGYLGSGTEQIVVFQDFFTDIDFPVFLTRNDEVTVPIALYNYLKKSQTVKLTIEKADWFELLEGDYVRSVAMGPGEIKALDLRIRAKKVGRHGLTIWAKGTKFSDAVKRTVEVAPDGKMHEVNFSDMLKGDTTHTVNFPAEAIDGANLLMVKVYPGLMAQAVEGLDSILRMPSGCFEQTSSSTYPNIMVLDYMKTTGQITPEIRMKAEGFINQGYQRLLSYEVPGGGFEWFGRAPAHKILTAYGLMEFYDMSRVYNVDPAVISRTQNWLVSQQEGNGSFKPTANYLDQVAAKFTKDVMRNTAYIAWALAKSEYKGGGLNKALDYLNKHGDEVKDNYTLALMANAFAYSKEHDAAFQKVMDRLVKERQGDGDDVFWSSADTSIGSQGKSADIETTALAAQAMIVKQVQPNLVNGVLNYLVKSKDTFGNWYSTQATVFALKVMVMAAEGSTKNTKGEVAVYINGERAGALNINDDNSDLLHVIDGSKLARTGENKVELSFGGEGRLMYQVVGRYYMPWKSSKPEQEPLSIDVSYDKTVLKQDDTVTCKVKVTNNREGDFGMVVVDLGVPPGFEVMSGDLKELVGSKTIGRFETTARQVIVYIDEIKMGKPISFEYRIKAKFPVKAQVPASKTYEYYNPEAEATTAPVEIVVNK